MTSSPPVYISVQSAPQLIPDGADVSVPVPVPVLVVVRVGTTGTMSTVLVLVRVIVFEVCGCGTSVIFGYSGPHVVILLHPPLPPPPLLVVQDWPYDNDFHAGTLTVNLVSVQRDELLEYRTHTSL
jgi:hypothetical protein